MCFRVDAAFYTQDDFGGVCGVLFEVALEEYEAVVLCGTVELGAVPAVAWLG